MTMLTYLLGASIVMLALIVTLITNRMNRLQEALKLSTQVLEKHESRLEGLRNSVEELLASVKGYPLYFRDMERYHQCKNGDPVAYMRRDTNDAIDMIQPDPDKRPTLHQGNGTAGVTFQHGQFISDIYATWNDPNGRPYDPDGHHVAPPVDRAYRSSAAGPIAPKGHRS